MTGDSDIKEEVRSEIQSLKVDLFDTTFQKIHEEFEKKKAQIKDLKTEDVDFITEFEKEARAVFTATDIDSAESASHRLTALIVGKVARVQDAAAAIQTAADLKTALSSTPKQPKPISIPKKVIDGLKNNTTLRQAWYADVLAAAQNVILTTPVNASSVTLSQKQIVARLEQMITRAGNGSASLNHFIIPSSPLTATSIVLNKKEIQTLIEAVDNTGTYSTKNWPNGSSLIPTVSHKDVYDAIVDKIKEEIVQENVKKLAKANAIDTIDGSALSLNDKMDKVLNGDPAIPHLTGESTWDFILDPSSTASKAAAAEIKSKLDEYKKAMETDKRYYGRFVEDMNKYVFSSIMTNAGTINETIRHALENSMITDDGSLREEFKDSFSSLTQSAKDAITDKVAQIRNDLEATKRSATVQIGAALTSMLTPFATSYSVFITGLGAGPNEDVALTRLSETLTAAGASLGTKEKEILDASQDSYLSAFDLARRQIERVNLITNRLLDLKTKNDKGAIAKISDPASKAMVQGFISGCTILPGLTKAQVDSVKAKYDGVKMNFINKIDKLETESKALEEIESKANGDIWELLTDNDVEKGPIKGILSGLTQALQDGLAALLRSLGLYNGNNVNQLKQRVDAIDQGEENKGFLEPMQAALTKISNKVPVAKVEKVANEPVESKSAAAQTAA
jgi:hypothetical protein